MRGGFEQDVALVTLPLFHSTAQTCQMNAGLAGGFRLVLLPRFDPAAVLETMQREEVGFWIGVPTMYWALLQARPPPPGRHRTDRPAPSAVRLGRRADAARSDAGVRGDVRRAHSRRLRAVGDVAGGVLQPAAPAEQARHRRPADLRRRRAVRGRRGRLVQRRRAGRDRDPRTEHHEGLLQPARSDRRGHARRLVSHRRHRHHRRRRLRRRSSTARRT